MLLPRKHHASAGPLASPMKFSKFGLTQVPSQGKINIHQRKTIKANDRQAREG